MISRDEAIDAVTKLLQSGFGSDLTNTEYGEIVVLSDVVVEYENAWVVVFDTRAALETKSFNDMLIPNRAIVPKDGSPAFYAPTDMSTDEYLAEIASGGGHWPVFEDDNDDSMYHDDQDLIDFYVSGATVRQVAEKFRVSLSSVKRLLRAHHVRRDIQTR